MSDENEKKPAVSVTMPKGHNLILYIFMFIVTLICALSMIFTYKGNGTSLPFSNNPSTSGKL